VRVISERSLRRVEKKETIETWAENRGFSERRKEGYRSGRVHRAEEGENSSVPQLSDSILLEAR